MTMREKLKAAWTFREKGKKGKTITAGKITYTGQALGCSYEVPQRKPGHRKVISWQVERYKKRQGSVCAAVCWPARKI